MSEERNWNSKKLIQFSTLFKYTNTIKQLNSSYNSYNSYIINWGLKSRCAFHRPDPMDTQQSLSNINTDEDLSFCSIHNCNMCHAGTL